MTPARFQFHCGVAADHPALAGHFPGAPIVPAVWLLDRVIAEVQRITGCRVGGVPQAKFVAVLLPREQAEITCAIEDRRVGFRIEVQREGAPTPVAFGSLALQPS
jgi:3-hydroxymyristoyl/3-hydroxydecanoyl-(acyl carrier protein) dehydratase